MFVLSVSEDYPNLCSHLFLSPLWKWCPSCLASAFWVDGKPEFKVLPFPGRAVKENYLNGVCLWRLTLEIAIFKGVIMVIPCYPSIPPGSGFSCPGPAPARLGPWPQDQKLSEQSALKPPWPHCNKRPTRLRRIYTWSLMSLMSLMSLSRQSFKSFSLAFLDCGDTAKTTGQKEWLKVWPGLCCSIAAAACQPGEISCGTFPHVWEQNCRNPYNHQITSGFSIRSPYFLWLSILEMTIKPYQPPLNPTPHQPIINPARIHQPITVEPSLQDLWSVFWSHVHANLAAARALSFPIGNSKRKQTETDTWSLQYHKTTYLIVCVYI